MSGADVLLTVKMDLEKKFSKLLKLVKNRNYEGVKKLIMNDDRLQTADFLNMIENTDEKNYTILHHASKAGALQIIKFLTELVDNNGVSVMTKSILALDVDGGIPLHTAAEYGRLDIVKYFLDEETFSSRKFDFVRVPHVNASNNANLTLLHYAAVRGNLEIIKFLVQKGADIYAETFEGDKAIHKAAKYGNKNIVEFFLDHGLSINDPGRKNFTPLHYAVECYHPDVFKFLIKNEADIYAENSDKRTPIYIAVKQGRFDILQFVFDLERSIINDPLNTRKNSTALHIAAEENNLKIVKWLIAKGANIHAKMTDGVTALHLAAMKSSNIEVVKFLVANGANIFDKTFMGNKALHFAARNGNEDIVEFFLDQGQSVDDRGEVGYTPLHFAAKHGHLPVANLLIQRGADANIKSDFGYKPIALADKNNHSTIHELLVTNTHLFDCVIQ